MQRLCIKIAKTSAFLCKRGINAYDWQQYMETVTVLFIEEMGKRIRSMLLSHFLQLNIPVWCLLKII